MPQPALQERVARLEGRVQSFDGRFDILERRIDTLDGKLDRHREELAARIDVLDGDLARRLTMVDQRVTKQFVWLVGIQVSVLLAVVAALVGR